MENRPYRPSWVDRLFDWIDGLPIHPAVFYLLMYVFGALLLHAAYWIADPDAFGTPHLRSFVDAIWISTFGYIHFLRDLARNVIHDFREQISGSDSEKSDVVYRFSTMPAWLVLSATLFTFVVVFLSSFDDTASFTGVTAAPLVSVLIIALYGAASYMGLPVVFIFALRQLFLVNETFSRYTKINIFHLEPLYGLTTITVNVGILMIVFMNLNYVVEVLVAQSSMRLETVVAFSIAMTVVSVAAFILPLIGIHNRIQAAKQEALGRTGEQIESLQAELFTHIQGREFEQLGGVEQGLNTLFNLRERLEKVQTWPWRPGTPRNFASAVLLPLLLWAVQQFAERFF